jgi:hypothetical protein
LLQIHGELNAAFLKQDLEEENVLQLVVLVSLIPSSPSNTDSAISRNQKRTALPF